MNPLPRLNMSKFWDNTAKKYAAQPIANAETYAATLSSVQTHLRPTSKVLEIGCGTGSTAIKLAPYLGSILGTDFSPAMIKICNDKLLQPHPPAPAPTPTSSSSSSPPPSSSSPSSPPTNVKFATDDICLPIGDLTSGKGSYDVVLGFNVLYLLSDPNAALRNINGLLKTQGLFISKNLVQDNMKWGNKILLKALPVFAFVGLAPSGIAFQTAKGLEGSLGDAGFEIVESAFPENDEQRRYVVARKTKEV